ncbi:MAG: DNA recombination protein RmuC [Methylocystis sp.]|nr:DNA recombination protein RmuC [Methylocystis sp.]MCA3583265.1 DNA recombination protein RmuC [Methylocystis sp.]MCA3588050.1 DNA recombination protein RmuC [Methylocystis sp.]MCA3591508.1 DNA recombination protein RmuC [Methylocystis sp.]
MNEIVLILGQTPVTLRDLLMAGAGVALILLIALVWLVLRANQARALEAAAAAERQREMDDKVAAMNQLQAELTARMQTMAEIFGGRQSDLVRAMSDRMDAMRASLGQGLQQQSEKQSENLGKLNERLAVIDSAQKNLADLTGEVLALKDILANKQSRGAFGQGRMEAIVRDGLPPSAYEFQVTLSNGKRPDCAIRLPGDERLLVVDAKFPLEAFQLLEAAKGDDLRLATAERQVRNDINKHIGDIVERYLIPGETQDMAFLFIPSESLYATIADRFEDVIQKAHRAKIIIVSPSLLMMAIQVMQAIVRDARMREQAGVLQKEVGLLLEDVRRLQERTAKLDDHFRLAQKDVGDIATSSDKIGKRGQRIEALEFEETRAAIPVVRAAE